MKKVDIYESIQNEKCYNCRFYAFQEFREVCAIKGCKQNNKFEKSRYIKEKKDE